MRSCVPICSRFAGLVGTQVLLFALATAVVRASTPDGTDRLSLLDKTALDHTQVPFEQNVGQHDSQIAFYARTFAGSVFVTHSGQLMSVLRASPGSAPGFEHSANNQSARMGGVVIAETFIGTDRYPPQHNGVQGEQLSAVQINYLNGADPSDWRLKVPSYHQLDYGQIYPGISLKLRAFGNNVEKLFYVSPGGDPTSILVRVDGAQTLSLAQSGELILSTVMGEAAFTAPVAWQEINGQREAVEVSYRLADNGVGYGFALGDFDSRHQLIIDPLLAATFLGGADDDLIAEVKMENGSLYAAGVTFSDDFPVTAGAFSTTPTSNVLGSPFVSRLSADLSTLEASTYIGTTFPSLDAHQHVGLDTHAGEVFLSYATASPMNPDLPAGFDPSYNGANDSFIAKLSGDLSTLLASTYFGGTAADLVRDLDVDNQSGDVCIGGITGSTDLPTTAGAHDLSFNGSNDGFVACLDNSLGTLLRSSYLGTSGAETVYSIHAFSGSLFAAGTTTTPASFPTPFGAFQTPFGQTDGFVALFSSTASLASATLIGSSLNDTVEQVVLDDGAVFVSGELLGGSGFPASGSFDTSYNGGRDIFVAKFDGFLSSLIAATYYGGSGDDHLSGMTVDSDGAVYLLGETSSADLPVTNNGFQQQIDGGGDLMVARMSSGLAVLTYSSFLRGANHSNGVPYGFDVPAPGQMYLPSIQSGGYIVTPGAFDPSLNGASEGMITLLTITDNLPTIEFGPPISVNESSGVAQFEINRLGDPSGFVEVALQTVDDSAIAGLDYVALSGAVRWQAGEASTKVIAITILEDGFDETTESFDVVISNPVGGIIPSASDTYTIFIGDNDTAGVTVTPSGGPPLTLSEPAGQAQFTVVLDSQPTSTPLFMSMSSDDTSAGVLSGADPNGELLISFTGANWNIPQSITVLAVDDDVDDGNQSFQVDFATLVNSDPGYGGLQVPSVDLITLDDDSAGFLYTPLSPPLITSEAGTSDSFMLSLSSEPLATVLVDVEPDADGMDEGMLSPMALTFTGLNWDVPQMVSVTGLDDQVVDGDIQYQVLLSSGSNDPGYVLGGLGGPLVINTDDDAIEVDVMVTVDNGLPQVMPFLPLTYVIEVNNLSPDPINGLFISSTGMNLDLGNSTWTCMAAGLSTCPPSGNGTINVNVDLDSNSRVTFEVFTSALNTPFEQAVLNALATLPAGFTDTNPINNFDLDSDLIFVFILFKDGLEAL